MYGAVAISQHHAHRTHLVGPITANRQIVGAIRIEFAHRKCSGLGHPAITMVFAQRAVAVPQQDINDK